MTTQQRDQILRILEAMKKIENPEHMEELKVAMSNLFYESDKNQKSSMEGPSKKGTKQ